MWCHEPIDSSRFHVDHQRPLVPEEDMCRPTQHGNTNFFNLAALCERCNLGKSNKNVWFPEALVNDLIHDERVAEYFRKSLIIAPTGNTHRLPSRAPGEGQFL